MRRLKTSEDREKKQDQTNGTQRIRDSLDSLATQLPRDVNQPMIHELNNQLILEQLSNQIALNQHPLLNQLPSHLSMASSPMALPTANLLQNNSYLFPPLGNQVLSRLPHQQAVARLQHLQLGNVLGNAPTLQIDPQQSYLASTIPTTASSLQQSQLPPNDVLGLVSAHHEEHPLLPFQKEIVAIQQKHSNDGDYIDFAKFLHTNVPLGNGGKNESFPVKLYRMLDGDFSESISWMPHGRSWKVHDPIQLEEKVLPIFFRHAKYASFMRQVR